MRSTKTGMETRNTTSPNKASGIVIRNQMKAGNHISLCPSSSRSRDRIKNGLAGLSQFSIVPGNEVAGT